MLPLKFVALSLGLVKDCTSGFAWMIVSVELRAVRAPKAPATSVTWPLLGRWTLQVPQTSQGSYLCTLALELCAVRCYV